MPIEVILEILAAAAVSGIIVFAAWPWRHRTWPGAAGAALGFCAAYLLAHKGLPELLPVDSTDLILHFAVVGLGMGVAVGERFPHRARWAARFVLSAAAAYLLLRNVIEHRWETKLETVMWIGGAGLALFLSWSALAFNAARVKGFTLPLVLVITAAGGAYALAESRSGRLAEMAGALAAAIGPLVVVGWRHRDLLLARGVAPVAALAGGALWLCGYFFAELPLSSALLLLFAPLLTVRKWWISAIVAAIAVGVAAYLAVAANAPAEDDPYACFYK